MKRRVIVCLGLLLTLFLLGSMTAIVTLNRSTQQFPSLVESHRIQSMREHLAAAGLRVDADLLAEVAGSPRDREGRIHNQQQLEEAANRCGSCHHQPEVQSRLDEINGTLETFQQSFAQLRRAETREQRETVGRETRQISERLARQTTEAAELASWHLTARSTQVAAMVGNARIVLWGTWGAVSIPGGFIAFHLMQRLTKPVEALMATIERVRHGELSARFTAVGDQEFRVLADALNHAHDELMTAHDTILHSERLAAVGKLAAGVAHEVLNPLASISSIIQLMRERAGSEEQQRQIELIMKETGRITQILRDLQTFSRPLPASNPVWVRIDELIEYTLHLVSYDERAKRVAITHSCGPDLPAIRGDADRLSLVFTNIMMNALDALNTDDQEGGILSIEAVASDGFVQISFVDNGPGMSDEELFHAFEPFFTTKAPGAGTGLGLWISHQVIEGHNGTIRLASKVGEGTKIVIALPSDLGPTGTADPTT